MIHRSKEDRPEGGPAGPGNGIEIEGLSKALRGRPIFTDADLVVPRATVVVIDGDNGAGKTTLVRILATVVSPDKGRCGPTGST